MISFERYLENQRHRLNFYRYLHLFLKAGILFLAGVWFFALSGYLLQAIDSLYQAYFFVLGGGAIASLLGALFWFFLQVRRLKKMTLIDACAEIENQSPYFREHPRRQGELRAVGSFLTSPDAAHSPDFQSAQIQKWRALYVDYATALRPPASLAWPALLFAVLMVTASQLSFRPGFWFPHEMVAWNPTQFQTRLPYQDSDWGVEFGAISGVAGSEVRFEAPSFGAFQAFLFLKEQERPWRAIPCFDLCELTLRQRGQYAVGTVFSRSTIFPLQVFEDEAPKATLFVRDQDDFVPEPTIAVENKTALQLHLTASDDLRLREVKLIHKFEKKIEVLDEVETTEKSFKSDYRLVMDGWKGGTHQVFIQASDVVQTKTSAPVTIQYADEDTLREERIRSVRALLDEWVHVLADLLESQADKKRHPMLSRRFREMRYPDTEDDSLIAAFVKELQLIQNRIEVWVEKPRMDELPELIEKVERAILYGLSLIFQEKTGEMKSASDQLASSREGLEEMLRKVRAGELELDSDKLKEAFNRLNKALEKLREKMNNLPQGPSDQMINREALQEQMDQSDQLSERIKEIQEQIKNGDAEGAIAELESLMNQLSILSKSIDQSMNQMKQNLDRGAIEASKKFQKDVQKIREKQKKVEEKTDQLKKRAEALEKESQKNWKPIDPDKLKEMDDEFAKLKQEQAGLEDELQEAVSQFDAAMKGSEWEQLFRSEESKQLEDQAVESMNSAERMLDSKNGFEAIGKQREAIQALEKLSQLQQQSQQQAMQGMSGSNSREFKEKVDILSSQGKGERERRRKIMESLEKKVDERFQSSHEQYFEELLQR